MSEHDERIPENQFRMAGAASLSDLVGRKVVRVFEVEGSDRGEEALLLDDGRLFLVSCDPIYDYDEKGVRTEEHWEVVVYDATDTEAGREFKSVAKSVAN